MVAMEANSDSSHAPKTVMTTVTLSSRTRARLEALKLPGDTFEAVLVRLLDAHEGALSQPVTVTPGSGRHGGQ